MEDKILKYVHIANGEKRIGISSFRNKEHSYSVARAKVKES